MNHPLTEVSYAGRVLLKLQQSADHKIEIQWALRDDPVHRIDRLAAFAVKRVVQSVIGGRLGQARMFCNGLTIRSSEL